MLANRPEWIGNLDGIPAADRNAANLARIEPERSRLEAARRAYLADPKNRWVRGDGYYGVKPSAEYDQINAKLAALDAIERDLAQGNRQLLVLDLDGERAKAAVAIGDVDTADHVAVFTPGMNSTVEGSLEGYNQDVSDLREKAEQALYDSGRDGASVAMVTWLNYEPPLNTDFYGADAMSDDRATDGANRLAPFLEGINASRADDPHLTALGHSYGSLTTGIALRDFPGTGVDEAIFFGSPGLGVDSAAEMNVPAGHSYNMAAENDVVTALALTEQHGLSPLAMSDMHQLSTDAYVTPDGERLEAAHGHSEYLRAGDKDTTTEWNMANIIASTGNVR